jgi:phosphohistidine phosphatase SixA
MALKAVYANGKVVTGRTHGEAFNKLPDEEKLGNDFVIGDWCDLTGKFVGDDGFFFTKKVLMIRHGQPACSYMEDEDPPLSREGEIQVEKLGLYLSAGFEFDQRWEGFAIISSPLRRCIQTMEILQKVLGLPSKVDSDLVDSFEKETPEALCDRIMGLMERLPQNSILISHCNFIQHVAECIDANHPGFAGIPPASMTLIDHKDVVYLGKGLPTDETVC